MRDFFSPARRVPSQYSLLVTFLTERMVLVCPPLGFPLGSQTSVVHQRPPYLALVSAVRFRCLLAHALTDSISIGRAAQTR